MFRQHKQIVDAFDAMARENKARLLYDERECSRPGVITRRIYKVDETLLFSAENLGNTVVSGTVEMSHAETIGYRYAMFDQAGRRVFPGNCSIELCAVLEAPDEMRSYFALPVIREYNCTPLGFEESDIPVLDVVRGGDGQHFTVNGSGTLLIYSNDSDNKFTVDGKEVTLTREGSALWSLNITTDGSHEFTVSK